MRISDWSSDVCSSDLHHPAARRREVDAVRQQVMKAGAQPSLVAFDAPGIGAHPHIQVQLLFGQHIRLGCDRGIDQRLHRSEEHTSELQSLMRISYAVFCLKKKNNNISTNNHTKQK